MKHFEASRSEGNRERRNGRIIDIACQWWSDAIAIVCLSPHPPTAKPHFLYRYLLLFYPPVLLLFLPFIYTVYEYPPPLIFCYSFFFSLLFSHCAFWRSMMNPTEPPFRCFHSETKSSSIASVEARENNNRLLLLLQQALIINHRSRT